MPHAQNSQDELDDLNIGRLLNADPTTQGNLDFLNRELEPGEKAEDAVDFEDIDDDDLAEEEDDELPALAGTNGHCHDSEPLGGLLEDTQDTILPESSNTAQDEADLDDLFRDVPSSPAEHSHGLNGTQQTHRDEVEGSFGLDDTLAASSGTNVLDFGASQDNLKKETDTAFEAVDFGAQHDLLLPPAPPENPEEALTAMWPKFKRDERPKFISLLPPKKAHYVGKSPLKPPKALQPTKVGLELEPDQELIFRSYGPAKSSRRELEIEAAQKGLILTLGEESEDDAGDQEVEMEDGYDGEMIGNASWNDIKIICEDWDAMLEKAASDPEANPPSPRSLQEEDLFGELDDDWEAEFGDRPPKKQKTTHEPFNFDAIPHWSVPSYDDPERATAELAKRVVLDLNDPKLLVEIQQPGSVPTKPSQMGGDLKRGAGSASPAKVLRRYNISNDEAYHLLKENHQSKVRINLGNLVVEHSMPALRLQYPYYKVKLARQEARSFHRPAMSFLPNVPVKFSRPKTVKRKRLKGQETKAIFQTTKDLSLADNSNVLLLEYSEEYPTMMSNFGMGSRLINYYRRKNLEDNARPKLDIGETAVLMPQDRSPFSIFGHIDPGEMVPTLYNSLFRAPVFKQNVSATDFLVIRNTTGVEGSTWYMRNIENLYVVGQQFPSIDVPGPHSRKVTTASKSRLKMIAYRKLQKNQDHRVSVGEITEHFPESTDMQNRQKLKEFMQFNREHKEWEMRHGESIPDMSAIRAMLKPEDLCLLEASQVGLQHLQDAGYGKDAEESDSDDGKEGQSLEQQLAPWHTTRNFIHATQGKAMLQLHGEGDPSGRGEAFSFIRTSMKGGFKALGESVEDKLDARKMKELGGHSYNVAKQQRAYEDSIRRIWEAQKKGLSALEVPSDYDFNDEMGDGPDDLFDEGGRSVFDPPLVSAAAPRGAEDDTTSQFSKFSTASQRGKVLRITRDFNRDGRIERVTEVVRDPRVIREYIRRRHAIEAENMTLSELKPTGDAEQDKRARKRLEEELARLERNKDRRLARDKQKLNVQEGSAMSPGSPGAGSPSTANPKATGTLRKCANCGQVGHIKTNKKLCPMLNGAMKAEDRLSQDASAAPTLF